MKRFDVEKFRNPGAEYRGKPFWAWNCKVTPERVKEQLGYFKKMGMGGATIHCRTGLDIPYLGTEFMECVHMAVEQARQTGQKICLYDEDRWPSGAAGGIVTKDKQYRARCLILTPTPMEEQDFEQEEIHCDSFAQGRLRPDASLLAVYEIDLADDVLHGYQRVSAEHKGANVWYAYLQISPDSPWYNNQSYLNTLDPRAVERFLQVTHETYWQKEGAEFGRTIPSIFTDEPQFTHKTCLGRAGARVPVVLPYTDDFESTYREAYGESFLDHLPEVVWELPEEGVSQRRYRYHDHLAERFACAFSDTVGNWCREHGIALTGHMMQEPTLESQTSALGEAMRQYRGFEIPGIDILCDRREYTTAKQAQSAAHQMGKSKVTSELYGVTNWDFDFIGHKLQGDWQAALGVTERVHHLSWMSMAGESKRDYPASIFFQSPWYEKYKQVEDHFARVNVALQSGMPEVRVGVIHPVESYWLYYGPREQTQERRNRLEQRFEDLTEWLLFGLMDFDFISERLLEEMPFSAEEGFRTGDMCYDVILVPGCVTLRRNTVRCLSEFARRGGKVIFAGNVAGYVDAQPSGAVRELAAACCVIPFEKSRIMGALEAYRTVDVRDKDGVRAEEYLYQMRRLEDGGRILFLANGKKNFNRDVPAAKKMTISLRGEYEVTELDTATGEMRPLACRYARGNTCLDFWLYEQDSKLLLMRPGRALEEELPARQERSLKRTIRLPDLCGYERSEPNVLLLDKAAFCLDGGAWEEPEEVLRMDNILRRRLGYPLKMDSFAQPWTNLQGREFGHRLHLRYEISAQMPVEGASLAMEQAERAEVFLNGCKVEGEINGWYVDPAIKKRPLPALSAGTNRLEVVLPYGAASDLEWCYLLGDFGVEVYGSRAVVVPAPECIGFGNLVHQKHPFYAGNMTWKMEVDLGCGNYRLKFGKFRAPLLQVELDGQTVGTVAYSPYALELGKLEGKHSLSVTAYGSRINAFGPIHLTDEREEWIGPEAWRSQGDAFSYEYQLKPVGILAAPVLEEYE